jgi:hypothetical protein
MATQSVVRLVALLGVSLCSPGDIGRESRDIPHVDRVEPDVVQTGDVATAFGKHLDGSHVADVLLADADVVALTQCLSNGATSSDSEFRNPSHQAATTSYYPQLNRSPGCWINKWSLR